jgi:hypothetical protein
MIEPHSGKPLRPVADVLSVHIITARLITRSETDALRGRIYESSISPSQAILAFRTNCYLKNRNTRIRSRDDYSVANRVPVIILSGPELWEPQLTYEPDRKVDGCSIGGDDYAVRRRGHRGSCRAVRLLILSCKVGPFVTIMTACRQSTYILSASSALWEYLFSLCRCSAVPPRVPPGNNLPN